MAIKYYYDFEDENFLILLLNTGELFSLDLQDSANMGCQPEITWTFCYGELFVSMVHIEGIWPVYAPWILFQNITQFDKALRHVGIL